MLLTRRKYFVPLSVSLFALISGIAVYHQVSVDEGWKPPADKPWKRPPNVSRAEYVEDRANFLLDSMINPKTGTIPRNIRDRELTMAYKAPVRHRELRGKKPFVVSAGPANVGGRTRAIAFDLTDTTGDTIFAGGPNSGLFRSTNDGQSWTKVSPPDELHSVTAVAQDPTQPNVWYYGTGEAQGSGSIGSFLAGDGLWKSTDSGSTWSQLAFTQSEVFHGIDNFFDLIHRIVVNPSNGDVYVAAHRSIWRSQNGGETFEAVLPTTTPSSLPGGITDVVINSDGSTIFAAFAGGATDERDGVWVSSTGNTGDWTLLAGGSMDTPPAGWPASGEYGRITISLEPTDENLLYVLVTNNHVNTCQGNNEIKPEVDLFRYDVGLGFWSELTANIPATGNCLVGNSPLAVQGGYDLTVAVSPDDPTAIFIGGTTLLRSNNAFGSSVGTSRIGGYGSTNNYSSYPNHHPDLHLVTFNPYKPGTFYTGSDGGIHRGDRLEGPPQYTDLNVGYLTAQYYHVAIAPEAGDPRAIGGMQDNGTWLTRGSRFHENLFGGDGVSVAIARDPEGDNFEDEVYLVGFQGGNIWRINSRLGFRDITPNDVSDSIFVTLFHLDHDNNQFVYFADGSRLLRNTDTYGATSGNWEELAGVDFLLEDNEDIRSITTSFGSYTANSKLYLGSNNSRIVRIDDPADEGLGFVPTDISPPQISEGTTVIGLAVDPSDDRVLLAVTANYDTPSIFFTENADSDTPDWQVIEGNLALPSIRSAAIVNTPEGRTLFVGTTVGLWSTSTVDGNDTVWQREAVDVIGASVIADIDLRPADNTMAIGTHGSGLYFAHLEPAGSTQMVFPWVSNNKGAFESILVMNNLNNAGVPLRITATRGDGTSEVVTRTLPPNGFLEESANSLFPLLGNGAGYTVAVEAPNNNLRGRWVTNNLTAESGESPSQGVAVVLPGDGEVAEDRLGNRILFNLLPLTEGFTSAPVLVNTGTEPADIRLRYVDASGNLVAESMLEDLPPNQPFAQVANALVPGANGDVALIAECDTAMITGVSFVFNDLGETAIGNATALDHPSQSNRIVYPWVSNNTDAFASIIVTNNLGDADEPITLTATREDGTTETVERTVPAGGFLREAAADLFSELGDGSGYTVFAESAAQTLHGGWITYNLAAASGQSPAVGVGIPAAADATSVRSGNDLLFGFLPSSGNFLSGPVITNLGDQVTDVILRYFDENGNLVFIDSDTLNDLEPGRPYPVVPNPQLGAFSRNFSLIASSGAGPITGVSFIFNGVFNEPAIGNATAVSSPLEVKKP